MIGGFFHYHMPPTENSFRQNGKLLQNMRSWNTGKARILCSLEKLPPSHNSSTIMFLCCFITNISSLYKSYNFEFYNKQRLGTFLIVEPVICYSVVQSEIKHRIWHISPVLYIFISGLLVRLLKITYLRAWLEMSDHALGLWVAIWMQGLVQADKTTFLQSGGGQRASGV